MQKKKHQQFKKTTHFVFIMGLFNLISIDFWINEFLRNVKYKKKNK